jgi:hypothetical protein
VFRSGWPRHRIDFRLVLLESPASDQRRQRLWIVDPQTLEKRKAEAGVSAMTSVLQGRDGSPSRPPPASHPRGKVAPPSHFYTFKHSYRSTACLHPHGKVAPRSHPPRRANQEPRTKNQELRTKKQRPAPPALRFTSSHLHTAAPLRPLPIRVHSRPFAVNQLAQSENPNGVLKIRNAPIHDRNAFAKSKNGGTESRNPRSKT